MSEIKDFELLTDWQAVRNIADGCQFNYETLRQLIFINTFKRQTKTFDKSNGLLDYSKAQKQVVGFPELDEFTQLKNYLVLFASHISSYSEINKILYLYSPQIYHQKESEGTLYRSPLYHVVINKLRYYGKILIL